jgi:hypothetical protein
MSSGTPIKPNNRKDPEGTIFTPKHIMPQTMRKNNVKSLGTPGRNAPVDVINSPVKKLGFEGGRRRRSSKRKTRKTKRTSTRRA